MAEQSQADVAEGQPSRLRLKLEETIQLDEQPSVRPYAARSLGIIASADSLPLPVELARQLCILAAQSRTAGGLLSLGKQAYLEPLLSRLSLYNIQTRFFVQLAKPVARKTSFVEGRRGAASPSTNFYIALIAAADLLTDRIFFAMLNLLRERNKHEYYLHLRDEGLLTLHPHVQDFMCEGACHS